MMDVGGDAVEGRTSEQRPRTDEPLDFVKCVACGRARIRTRVAARDCNKGSTNLKRRADMDDV